MRRFGLFLAALATLVASVAVTASGGGTSTEASWMARDLGTLGGSVSSATAISASGQVVGSSFTTAGSWHAFSWTQAGKMVDLGPLGDLVNSWAVGVNANGQVTGYGTSAQDYTPGRAFSWTRESGMIDLGTLGGGTHVQPTAINSSGQVVGFSWATNGQAHAFSWTQAGRMIDLGTLGGTGAQANDVNDGGEVVGLAGTGRGPHAFRWTQAGRMVDLGTLGGVASEAMAISESGQIVGSSMTSTRQTHAFLWTPARGMVDFGTLGGSTSSAIAVNIGSQVVGSSTTPAGTQHAFSWTQAGGMVDLGTLGGGASTPAGVSASGQVVGYSTTAGGAEHAFVWENGRMTDLGTLGAPQSRALAINDQNQIVGYSFTDGGWGHRALLWAPVAVGPVIGKPTPAPVQPLAGKRFTVSFKVTRSDTGKPLASGTMVCDPSVAGKVLRHVESFKGGTARLSFVVPASAKGKLLKVRLTIKSGGQSATKVVTFRIR